MDVEIVTVGAELLLGLTVDTNAADISRALASVGARVVRKATVPDEAGAVRDAVAAALGRSGAVVVTGGLGPTRDDVTKHAVAGLFGMRIATDPAYLAELEARWTRLGRAGPMPDANRTQAEVPDGATVLPNPRGTAPGLWLENARGLAILLPGVPREMRGLLEEEVVPRIARRQEAAGAGGTVVRSRVLRTTGIAESALADVLRATDEALTDVTLAYLPTLDGVDLRLTVRAPGAAAAEAGLEAAAARFRPLLGAHCYAEGETDLAAVVLDLLAGRGATLAVAESCTGGLLGARLTAIPGASAVFRGGVVAYDDAVKRTGLDVPTELLAAHGAVSEPVVRAMAEGVRRRLGTTAAAAVSGVAGPGGGTPDKPVGTVWLAAVAGGDARAVRIGLPGDRHDVRHRAAQAALDLLRRLLRPSAD